MEINRDTLSDALQDGGVGATALIEDIKDRIKKGEKVHVVNHDGSKTEALLDGDAIKIKP